MLFFLLLVFLIPLAVYCLVLAVMNRRPRPVMVRGLWDCIGLVFAVSGLLLVVGPAALHTLYDKALAQVPLDKPGFAEATGNIYVQYWGITLFYFLLLVTGIGLLIWWRWNKTIIYNVDAERFDAVLHHTLTRLGFEVSRSGNQLMIGRAPAGRAENVEPNAPQDGIIVAQEALPIPGEALLVVESFSPMGNVTLHWFAESPSVRDEIENALDKNLAGARLYENPASTWFLGIAGAVFSVVFVLSLIIVLGVWLPRR